MTHSPLHRRSCFRRNWTWDGRNSDSIWRCRFEKRYELSQNLRKIPSAYGLDCLIWTAVPLEEGNSSGFTIFILWATCSTFREQPCADRDMHSPHRTVCAVPNLHAPAQALREY